MRWPPNHFSEAASKANHTAPSSPCTVTEVAGCQLRVLRPSQAEFHQVRGRPLRGRRAIGKTPRCCFAAHDGSRRPAAADSDGPVSRLSLRESGDRSALLSRSERRQFRTALTVRRSRRGCDWFAAAAEARETSLILCPLRPTLWVRAEPQAGVSFQSSDDSIGAFPTLCLQSRLHVRRSTIARTWNVVPAHVFNHFCGPNRRGIIGYIAVFLAPLGQFSRDVPLVNGCAIGRETRPQQPNP